MYVYISTIVFGTNRLGMQLMFLLFGCENLWQSKLSSTYIFFKLIFTNFTIVDFLFLLDFLKFIVVISKHK